MTTQDPIKVLIIDDNLDDRRLCRRCLSADKTGKEFQFLEAGSGELGVTLVESHIPDCVLLDYSLPGRDGIEVLKEIRDQYPYMPVVMLTGLGNESIAVQIMKEGAQDYVVKSDISEHSLPKLVLGAIEWCQMQKRIEDQRDSLAVFTRALAHDLQEPIRAIQSFLGLALGVPELPQTARRYLEYIEKASSNMEQLVQTVHSYTMLDGEELHLSVCNTQHIISDVLANLTKTLEEKKARITFGALPNVYANETHLKQLFQNLIHNAVQYCDKEYACIKIGVEDQNNYNVFFVQDNGPGIEEKNLNKIFAPFTRLIQQQQKGAGIGLATCKKIVESHGGKIWCTSQESEGATFYFSLPVHTDALSPSGEDMLDAPVNGDKSPPRLANMLLIEDNPLDVELTRIMLMGEKRLKCNFHVAGNGAEALSLIENGNVPDVDLILLDINVPVMDGFEFLEKVKKHEKFKNINIVMCSTSPYQEDIKKAKSLGALDYIVKPTTIEKLEAAVAKANRVTFSRAEDGYLLLQKPDNAST